MRKLAKFVVLFGLLLGSGFAIAAPININTADADALATSIKGVGKKKAAAIVAYRTAHGPFKSVDDLIKVEGMGKALVDQNRPNLTIK